MEPEVRERFERIEVDLVRTVEIQREQAEAQRSQAAVVLQLAEHLLGMAENQQRMAESQERMAENQQKLAEAQQRTEWKLAEVTDKLDGLMGVIDDWIRRSGPPPPVQ